MHTLRRGLLLARGLLSLLLLIGICQSSWAQGQQVIFSAVGDIPYGSSEFSTFQQQIANHNKYSPSAFFVHVGDITHGGQCSESNYSSVANMLKGLAAPAYIVPGDNETSDCSSPATGMNYFLKYFNEFEQNFCGAPYPEHQSVRPENFAFTMSGVLFIGLNLSYGGTSAQQQAADWVTQQFEAKVSQVRAAVVLAHYSPGNFTTFSTPFRQAAAAFAKPILFLHGHGHAWSTSYPFPEKNIFRVQVNKGINEDPIQVTVTTNTSSPANAFILKRNPWSDKSIVNMPPCANAGPDQQISGAAIASLNGQATDDGDPSSGALTTTWSQLSGSGTATFGNANALATTANFSDNGVYVLQLTADDGQLQNSDEVTIVVNSSSSSEGPAISSFTPASGPEGAEVTITGSFFSGTTGVSFNGNAATSIEVDSDAQIRAKVPAGATRGTGKIVVTTVIGSATSTADFTVIWLNQFSFVPKHDTYVKSTSPTSNNGAASALKGKTGASEVVQSYLKFEVTGLNGAVNSAKLRLYVSEASADGGSIYLVSDKYKSTATPWVENGLNWNNAPGMADPALSSTGAVSTGQWVEFDVTAAIVGNGAYSFGLKNNISDRVDYRSKEYGAATAPQLVIQTLPSYAPILNSFAPSDGPVETEVTIIGNNFIGAMGVTFNGVLANFSLDSNTQIRAKAPAGAATGKIRITNAEGTGSYATDFIVTATPVIGSFTPGSGAENTEVTIAGSNFTATTSVTFNGNAATLIYVDSDTQIRAYIPTGTTPGKGKIVVTNSAGSATSTADFTVMPPPLILMPAHDVYVNSFNPTSNYGSSSTVRAKVSSSETFISYLKFEVTGMTGPLVSAKLRLYVTNSSADGGAVYLVSNDYLNTATPWVESGLLWDNAPSITGTPLSAWGTATEKQWVELDMTAAITGNGTYSFGLKNNGSDAVYYSSKESSNDPQLVIQTPLSASTAAKQTSDEEAVAAAIPSEFVLEQNYPNPFPPPGQGIFDNPSTQIRFGLPQAAHVTLKLYTINGAEVRTLVDQAYPAGRHALTFHAKNLPSGTYFYVMQAGTVRQARRLMLVK